MIALPRLGRGDGPMLGICVGHAMTHWYPGAFLVMLPFFAADLGLSLTEVGFLIGLRSITSTLVNLPGGMIVDMIGRRKLIMAVAIAWAGIPYLFLGLTTNFVLIAIFMSIVGVGNLLYHPAALSSLSELYPSRRGFATAMHSLGASIGDTLSPFVVGIVLTWLTWREVTVLNAVPGLVMGLIYWLLMRRVKLARPAGGGHIDVRAYGRGFASLARNGSMVRIALLGGARAMTQTGLATFLPIYLASVAGLSAALVGTYMAVVQAAGIVSGPISGSLSDRLGRRPLIAAGMISTSVLLMLLMALNVEWLFVLVLALIGFFLYSTQPVLNAWALDVAPPHLGGTSIGILFASQSLLGGLAPVIGGAIADTFGLPATFYFIAATVLAANVLIFAIREPSKEADAASTVDTA
ncbi:MAG: MFS transporter [Chloroflexota bacterium]|nr:MFS transporter [Chloroflexota bacterium]